MFNVKKSRQSAHRLFSRPSAPSPLCATPCTEPLSNRSHKCSSSYTSQRSTIKFGKHHTRALRHDELHGDSRERQSFKLETLPDIQNLCVRCFQMLRCSFQHNQSELSYVIIRAETYDFGSGQANKKVKCSCYLAGRTSP